MRILQVYQKGRLIDKAYDCFRKEFNYPSFLRTMNLPENSDITGIKTKYQNGILSFTIPKIRKSLKSA